MAAFSVAGTCSATAKGYRRAGMAQPYSVSHELERWLQSEGEKTLGSLVELFEEKGFAIVFVLLLGVPALAWGVSTRARRRQGWWGTGFGAAGLALVTSSLLDGRVSLLEVGLGTAYSLVVGLLLGYLVIRADSFLSGARGRRARRGFAYHHAH